MITAGSTLNWLARRVDRVAVLDGVERALGRRDQQLLTHSQRLHVAHAVRIRDRLDRHFVVIRHRRERVALVDRDLLHGSPDIGGDRQRIAAGRDGAAACERLRPRSVGRGRNRRTNRWCDGARARRGRCREREARGRAPRPMCSERGEGRERRQDPRDSCWSRRERRTKRGERARRARPHPERQAEPDAEGSALG